MSDTLGPGDLVLIPRGRSHVLADAPRRRAPPLETLLQETVRRFVSDRVLPEISQWFEEGVLPRELAPELGKLGLLGMHLEGYGCSGASAVDYGIACLELEAADSGLRSMVSVQGSLAMYPIWAFGSEEQKNEWLPALAAGESCTT